SRRRPRREPGSSRRSSVGPAGRLQRRGSRPGHCMAANGRPEYAPVLASTPSDGRQRSRVALGALALLLTCLPGPSHASRGGSATALHSANAREQLVLGVLEPPRELVARMYDPATGRFTGPEPIG